MRILKSRTSLIRNQGYCVTITSLSKLILSSLMIEAAVTVSNFTFNDNIVGSVKSVQKSISEHGHSKFPYLHCGILHSLSEKSRHVHMLRWNKCFQLAALRCLLLLPIRRNSMVWKTLVLFKVQLFSWPEIRVKR